MRSKRAFLIGARHLLPILLALSAVCCFQLRGSPLEQWYWRSPIPQGNSLHNVVSVNGTWVALGELGTILTSSDGTNWVTRESGVTTDLRGCAYGNNRYVIVGDFGTVLTSPNGISWALQYPGTFYSLNAVTYADNRFVSVGEQTSILTSPDGVNWTSRSSGDWELFDIINAQSLYVAVGGQADSSGVVLTSPDGITWTIRLRTGAWPFRTVAYGAGRFAIVRENSGLGGSRIWTSDNGVDWQVSSPPLPTVATGLYYALGNWLVISGDSYDEYNGQGSIFLSPDLENWSEPLTNTIPVSGIASRNGQIIASRIDGACLTSWDGWNWRTPSTAALPTYFRDLEYVNDSFVEVGLNQIAFSHDGATWTNLITLTNTGNLLSITYGKGRYVAGGEYRMIWTSTDGLNWTNPAPELSIEPYVSDVSVAYGNGVFVGAAGYDGDVLTSSDGLNWMVQQLNTNEYSYLYFSDVRFGGGRFVAVGGTAIATSVDGTNWFFQNVNLYLRSVACGNGIFVAVGDNGMLVSSDGTNWTQRTSTTLQSVGFGSGFFVATGPPAAGEGDSSVILISSDGIHWLQQRSNTPRYFSRVAFGNGTFLLAGDENVLMQSDPLIYLSLTMRPAPQLSITGPGPQTYRVDYAESLGLSTVWNTLGTFPVTNSTNTFSDLDWTNSSTRFYRAVLVP